MCKCNESRGCATCKKWTDLNQTSRIKWGVCGHYRPGDRLRITMGDIVERDGRVETTSSSRCASYEAK